MAKEENKTWFFGWTNIKWAFKEFGAMYSNKDSYFSKKRFESSIAFLGGMFLIIGHAVYNRNTITNSEVLADAALLFMVAGYAVNQIQKEKKEIAPTKAADKKTNTSEPEGGLPPVKDDGDLVG